MTCIVVLDRPKSPDNVGTIIRSSLALGADKVILIAPRWPLDRFPIDKLKTDPSRAARHIQVEIVETSAQIKLDRSFRAVMVERDLDFTISFYLDEFVHAQNCMYIFGPEDGHIDPNDWNAYPRMSVEIRGLKPLTNPLQGCLNLATAASIVLYDRAAKMLHSR